MGREHQIALQRHRAISTDHRAKPRHRARIRRLAVIRSDSQGFRIVSKLSGRISATRPSVEAVPGSPQGSPTVLTASPAILDR
jgi:hypothetical protein